LYRIIREVLSVYFYLKLFITYAIHGKTQEFKRSLTQTRMSHIDRILKQITHLISEDLLQDHIAHIANQKIPKGGMRINRRNIEDILNQFPDVDEGKKSLKNKIKQFQFLYNKVLRTLADYDVRANLTLANRVSQLKNDESFEMQFSDSSSDHEDKHQHHRQQHHQEKHHSPVHNKNLLDLDYDEPKPKKRNNVSPNRLHKKRVD
jgi:hypothetical protein